MNQATDNQRTKMMDWEFAERVGGFGIPQCYWAAHCGDKGMRVLFNEMVGRNGIGFVKRLARQWLGLCIGAGPGYPKYKDDISWWKQPRPRGGDFSVLVNYVKPDLVAARKRALERSAK